MTKQIRIENADTSNWPVQVTVENKDADGNWKAEKVVRLDHPTQMAQEYLTSHRHIVIEEKAAEPAAS